MPLNYITKPDAQNLCSSFAEPACLLLDSGQSPELMRVIYMHVGQPEFSTLLPPEQYGEAALQGPLLVRLNASDSSSLIGYFLSKPNLGLLLCGPAALKQMTEHCRRLFFQKVEAKPLFLRFYDQRVLLPLFLDLEKSGVANFFGEAVSRLLAVEETDDGEEERVACYTPDPRPEKGSMPQAPFTLTTDNLAAMEANHFLRQSRLLHKGLMAIPAYAGLPKKQQDDFLRQARREASLFGLDEFTTLRLFLPIWLLVAADAGNSRETMSFLGSPEHNAGEKISLLNHYRLFMANPYPCPINPVRLLARHDLYRQMPQWVEPDGNRRALDAANPGDRVAMRSFAVLYNRYEKDAAELSPAFNRIVGKYGYRPEQLQVNFHHRSNLAMEDALVSELKREMGYV